MNSEPTKKTIAYRFFLFDTYLNWCLGILFLFFYKPVEKIMSNKSLLPDIIWIIIGAGLLLFGIWQTYIILNNKFRKNEQLFSCIMAWLCFLILTYALVFMNFDLFVTARIIIWIGNIYMLILGFLYFISFLKQ